ncbi:AAA family ATPase [Microcoleus sp. Pol7_A1]|uniref:AAA family ATPase n=1 Tax=Microcoleus sp. Pol7_A1 TaxID=2818893 RepID=UPI002FCF046A
MNNFDKNSDTPTKVKIPNYQIISTVYSGSRTLVYRAIRTCDQLPVVIKLLKNDYPTFSELVQFRNQYTIAKNLNSPSIVQTYSLEPYENGCALVMEDFGGISLQEWAVKGKNAFSLREFLEVARSLCNALDILYRHRIIHKDIKPSNILINPSTKEVKLIDFSIASLLPRETQTPINPNVLEGTLSYISPEQTGRMNREIDYRTDFYSLGVTFYELLTGELPFQSKEPMELVHCHIAKIAPLVHEINQKIPPILSEIVSKLMAKNVEHRYQSALGVKFDLERCSTQLQEIGQIEYFEIAQKDVSDRFTIPEKLYGRENEVNQLLAAFERVSTGNTEIMLVAGFSGIGKTAVVNEVHKPIVRQRGYFIKGKYDQFKRNIPFSAFVQAFRDLMGQLLSESDAKLQTWKNQIILAVGENRQVLIDVIPELENIIGKQPPATELSGSAAQNRFNLLFQKFVQVFTHQEHPLVMFLDDLQWADSASLNLLKLLLQDTKYLLVLGAYRDNEVSPVHPFILTVDEIVKTGATVNTMTLQPLRESEMNCLVADTLNCQLSLTELLTKLVYQKTQGNPFFATQFLKVLHDDKLISFDWDICHWQCDIAKVKALAITDDVVEFMALQLQKLQTETQNILKLAACIGAEFDLNTLIIVSEKSVGTTAMILWEALQEGLLIPTTTIYKFFTQSDSEEFLPASANPTYRFLHDRVQEAAYLLIPEEQKQLTHLAIGQLLLQNTDKAQQNERIFEIVNQLNYGISLLSSLAQCEQYAQLNLRAGRKAKESTAYSAAQNYLAQGIQLLRASDWDVNPNLRQSLYEEAAEVALLNCDFEQMESLIQVVLQQTTTLLGQVKVYEVKLQAYKVQNQQLQAITVGREILQKLGVSFPESVTPLEIQQYVENTLASLPSCAIEELVNFPVMQDENALAALRIMTSLVPSVHQVAPHLFPIIACEEVNLSLKYGNSPFSAPGYADFGIIVSSVLNKLEEGYQFGQLALKIMEKFSDRSVQSMTQFKVAAFNQSNRESIQKAINLLKESYKVGLETGDSVHSLVSTSFRLMYTYLSGAEGLETLLEELAIYQAKFATSQHFLSWAHILRYSIKNLTEFSETPSCLGSDASDEAEYVSRLCKENDEVALHLFYLCKLMLSFLFRDIAVAIQDADEGEKYLKAGMGMPSAPVYYYYDSLARLTLYPTVDASQQVKLLSQVETNQAKVGIYVSAAPINYQHKYFLVEALRCSILGNRAEAIDMYDRAIVGAKANGYIQEEALANELAAKFYLDWGKEKVAQAYMIEAYYCYARWGAKAKVADLERRYGQLLAAILGQANSALSVNETVFAVGTVTSTTSSSTVSNSLDLCAILKASHAISGEIELSKLLSSLLEIVIENAGADKCVLMLLRDDRLLIKGSITLGSEPVVLQRLLVEESQEIPHRLIYKVKHNRQTVVLLDATAEPTLINDPYIMRQQPKSILCSPILHQGKLRGILYLENNLVTGAFTSDRIELLNLLCAQAAISIENARLYERSQTYAQQLEQALQNLQQTQLQMIQSEKMSALGNLVAGVAHEINNPVGFLTGNLNEAKRTVQDLTEHLALYRTQASPANIAYHAVEIDLDYIIEDLPKMIDSMQLGCDRIKGISTSLRTFSRADKDYKAPFNIHSGLDSTILILKYRLKANERRPAIVVVKDYGNIPDIECFPGQLNQVFMNIFANAIDALEESNTNRSFAEIEANPNRITIQTSLVDNGVKISIADNGRGMNEEIKAKIFDHLFTTKAVGKGTGLGLAIARQIVVEKHSGSLHVNSIMGTETEFIVTLPTHT